MLEKYLEINLEVKNALENNIPVDINIKKSQFQGVPICEFDKNSRASISYNGLAVEVLEKTSN